MFYSIRWRLLFSLVLVIAVALGTAAFFVSQAATSEIEGYQDRTETEQSERLKAMVSTKYNQSKSWQEVQRTLEQVSTIYFERVLVVNERGMVVADSRRTLLNTFVRDPVRSDRQLVVAGPDGEQGTLLINPEPAPGEPALAQQKNQLPSINRFLIWSGLVAVSVAVVVTFFLSRRILAPMESLSKAAGALARGDLSRRVTVRSKDEVGELGHTFNVMADELEVTEEIRRSLVADVAHELRTPLSNIRGYLEAINDGLATANPDVLGSMHEEVILLTRLIEDLQELTLAESGQLALHPQTSDLADLVRRAVASAQPQAEAKDVRITTEGLDQAPAQLDPERVSQVLRNLLVNACNYTSAGGSVRVTVNRSGDEYQVVVEDTGSGIPEQELPYVFERFYRVDKSRSRATGGVGLGLTIARRLVEAHGGTITVRSQEGLGTTFTLTLPAEPFPKDDGSSV